MLIQNTELKVARKREDQGDDHQEPLLHNVGGDKKKGGSNNQSLEQKPGREQASQVRRGRG